MYEWNAKGIFSLCLAVVVQAATDYKRSLRMLRNNPRKKKYRKAVKECEHFFLEGEYPRYYEMVFGVEGRVIVDRIRKEVRHGNQKRKTAEFEDY